MGVRMFRAPSAGLLLAILVFVCPRGSAQQQEVVTDIEIHGNRRIPADTVKARIFTHAGRCVRPGRAGARLQLAVEHRLLRRHPLRARADAQGLESSTSM